MKQEYYDFGYNFGRNGSLFGLVLMVFIVAPIKSIYQKNSYVPHIVGAWEGMLRR